VPSRTDRKGTLGVPERRRRRRAADANAARIPNQTGSGRVLWLDDPHRHAHPPVSPPFAVPGATQRPSWLQTFGAMQSSTDVHSRRHSPPEHRYGTHELGTLCESTTVRSSRHVEPLTAGVHFRSDPQVKPATHSASVAHCAAHSCAVAQTRLPGQEFVRARQLPALLHAAVVSSSPSHLCGAQGVSSGAYSRHAPWPSQWPSVLHELG
jgi:hypothetical protein